MKQSGIIILFVLTVCASILQSCKSKIPDRRIELRTAKEQIRSFGRLLDPNQNPEQRNIARIRSFMYSAEFFSKKDVEAVLFQNGCKGVRLYHALDSSGKNIMLIVGVNKNGEDMLPDSTFNRAAGAVYDEDNHIISSDETLRCPSMCDNGLSSKSETQAIKTTTEDTAAKRPGDSVNRRSKRTASSSPDSLRKP